MTPVNRRRPADAELERIRQDIADGLYTGADLARKLGLHKSCVYRWLYKDDPRSERKAGPRYRWQIDPEGFDKAVVSNFPVFEIAEAWQCGRRRVARRYLELTGIRRETMSRRSADLRAVAINAVVPFQPGRREMLRKAEQAKRAQLRQELARLLEVRLSA